MLRLFHDTGAHFFGLIASPDPKCKPIAIEIDREFTEEFFTSRNLSIEGFMSAFNEHTEQHARKERLLWQQDAERERERNKQLEQRAAREDSGMTIIDDAARQKRILADSSALQAARYKTWKAKGVKARREEFPGLFRKFLGKSSFRI